jgi:hypothetical protein
VFLGAELTLLINLKKEMNLIEEKTIGILQVIKEVVSPVEEKKCNVRWKGKLQQRRLYFTPVTIKSIKHRLNMTCRYYPKKVQEVTESYLLSPPDWAVL